MDADNRNHSEDEALAALLARVGPRTAPPVGARARIEAALLARQAALRRGWRLRAVGWSGAALAASLLLAVVQLQPPAHLPTLIVASADGASFLRSDGTTRSLPVGAAVTVGATIHAGAGVALGIGDGGSLRLAGESVVRYLPDGAFELAAGAAYYDSLGPSGRRDRAIELRTPFGAVRDIGTQYEARLTEAALRVRVREGRVEVEGASEALSAGAELMLDAGGARYAQIALTGEDWAWAERLAPPLPIDGATVDTYLRWVARESGLSLRYTSAIAGTSARATLLRGTLPPLAPVATLDAILPATDLEHSIESSELRIAYAGSYSDH